MSVLRENACCPAKIKASCSWAKEKPSDSLNTVSDSDKTCDAGLDLQELGAYPTALMEAIRLFAVCSIRRLAWIIREA